MVGGTSVLARGAASLHHLGFARNVSISQPLRIIAFIRVRGRLHCPLVKSFMESGSRVETFAEPPPHRLANIAGTLIALVTLILPVAAIAYYSTSPPPSTPNTIAPTSSPVPRQGL